MGVQLLLYLSVLMHTHMLMHIYTHTCLCTYTHTYMYTHKHKNTRKHASSITSSPDFSQLFAPYSTEKRVGKPGNEATSSTYTPYMHTPPPPSPPPPLTVPQSNVSQHWEEGSWISTISTGKSLHLAALRRYLSK